MNTNTTRLSALVSLALISMLAFSGCSQKAHSEEKTKVHATVPGTAAKQTPTRNMQLAQAYPAQAELAAPPRVACTNCGVVVSVKETEQEGKGSGLGVVAGGVLGGLVGNQVGNGTGRDLATIAGAVGGAFAGNSVEKKMKKTKIYEVTVQMENGDERVLHYKASPGVMAGDKIKVDGEKIVRQ